MGRIGFNQEETEEDTRKSELGMEFVRPEKDPYKPHLKQHVEVITSNNVNYAGVYQGVTTEHRIVLLPNICFEYGSRSKVKSRERDIARIEKSRPIMLNLDTVVSVIPMRIETFKIISTLEENSLEYQI